MFADDVRCCSLVAPAFKMIFNSYFIHRTTQFLFNVCWRRPDFLKHDILLRRRHLWVHFDNTKKKWQLRFCLLFRGWLWYSSSSLVWSPQTSEKWPWRLWLTRFSSKLVAFRGLSWFLLNLLDETIIYWILSALYLMYVQWSQKWFYEMNILRPLNHFAFRHSKFLLNQ